MAVVGEDCKTMGEPPQKRDGVTFSPLFVLSEHAPMVCPKCDYECTDGQGLTITDPDSSLAGTYCIRCWALHIAAVVPKMVPKDTAKEAVP